MECSMIDEIQSKIYDVVSSKISSGSLNHFPPYFKRSNEIFASTS